MSQTFFTGEYKGGQELSLSEVAEKLGVSRTPVREAFQELAAEGLIELRMNKSAIVRPIDRKFITDHYEMRELLESEAAARAAENGMNVSGLLERLYDMEKHIDTVDGRDYAELNQQIHLEIWKSADNNRLSQILMNLWNGPSFGKANSEKEHYEKSTKEHIEVLTAIRQNDAKTARHVMEEHIMRSMNNVLKHYQE